MQAPTDAQSTVPTCSPLRPVSRFVSVWHLTLPPRAGGEILAQTAGTAILILLGNESMLRSPFIQQILRHLGLPSEIPARTLTRAPSTPRQNTKLIRGRGTSTARRPRNSAVPGNRRSRRPEEDLFYDLGAF